MTTYLDIMKTAIMLRGGEKMAIVCIAAFISYLGYRLFVKGVESQETKLEGEVSEFKLSLSGTGPGMFFMAFGAIILTFSISTKLNIKEFEEYITPKQQEEKQGKSQQHELDGRSAKSFSVSYLSQNQSKYLELSKSINTLRDTFETLPKNNIAPNDLKLISSAIDNLEKERNVWVVSIFGKKSHEAWARDGDDFLINPENVKQEIRNQLEDIKPWMTHTLNN